LSVDVRAVSATDKGGFVVEAVVVVVTRGRALVLDVTTLAADLLLGFPPAASVASTVGGVVEELTLVTAAVGVTVPFTLSVVGTSVVVGVAVRTAVDTLTLARHGVPFAHGVEKTVSFVDHGGASTLTLVEIPIPSTILIGVARSLGVVAVAASKFTSFRDLVDFAIGDSQAIVLELLESGVVEALDTNTLADTGSGGRVPHTVERFLTRGFGAVTDLARAEAEVLDGSIRHLGSLVHGVAIEARAVTFTSRLVEVLTADALTDGSSEPLLPFATRVFLAGVEVVLTFARFVTLSSLPVPEAGSIGIAGVDVEVLLTTLLLALVVVPFASASEGPAESLILDEGAGLGASVRDVGPHARSVSVTFALVEVHGGAIGGAFRARPFTVISTLALGFGGEGSTVTDALVDGGVPHAISVLVTGRLVGVAVSTRDLTALAREITP
jgi:hypothetical protein